MQLMDASYQLHGRMKHDYNELHEVFRKQQAEELHLTLPVEIPVNKCNQLN
jgi:hypothetical protein